MKSLVFAAGLGTRLKPITDTKPKALVEVGGKTLLAHTLDNLLESGFDDIVVNVHHFADQIIDFIRSNPRYSDVKISDEREGLLDTGGGLRKASRCFHPSDAPILIHNVDILSNVDLAEFYNSHFNAQAALLVSERKTSRYLLGKDNRLVGWTNIDTGEIRSPHAGLNVEECRMLAFSGIHLVSPDIVPMMASFPEKISIIDFYLSVCDKTDIRLVNKTDLHFIDVGKLNTLHLAKEFVGKL